MYKLLKERGNNMNITLVNTEKHTVTLIGKMSMKILSIIEECEHLTFSSEESAISITDQWDLNINDTTAEKLTNLIMTIRKPIRDQRKKSEQNVNKIDALDVLLGLASYK